jgi:hypothetical protein
MKKVFTGLLLGLVLSFGAAVALPTDADAATRVNGYYRSNGTYVKPYYRSDSDRSKLNNYSTKGNTNPYTGKKGTKKVKY